MVWTFTKRKRHRRYDHTASIENASSYSDSEIAVDDYFPSRRAPTIQKVKAKSASALKSKNLRVTFSNVQTRHYRRILGDNPHADIPLSLGWNVACTTSETVDEHEARLRRPTASGCVRKIQKLERDEREALLRRAGYSKERLQLEERRRRVVLLLEWTYRHNREESVSYRSGSTHGTTLFKRYIM